MDPEVLKQERKKFEEEIRKQVMEEINKNYYLTPKSQKLEVSDIFAKYKQELLEKGKTTTNGVISIGGTDFNKFESIKQAIRKVVCMHFGVGALRNVPKDKYEDFRTEIERVIVEYLDIERKE